ncbi:MAG: sodium:proton antiporter [Bacteroidota bacterium]
MNLNLYSVLTVLVVLTACFSYVNYRYIKLPATIGIMVISLVCSVLIMVTGKFYPALMAHPVRMINSLDFETLLMRVMLSFLLFAAAIHIDVRKLKKEMAPVLLFATIGVLISTAVIGTAMYFVFQLFSVSIPFIYCLVFGALISPTDPIAVLGILKQANITESIETKISGESLFNDGVGVVIFVSILEIATGTGELSVSNSALLFVKEAGGGILWGVILGYAGYFLIRSIDNYQVEVLITIATVMGGYLFAYFLHISGPLAMVVAGIIIGNKGKELAMSDLTKDYLNKFWELVDVILNALLFLLIGLEMVVLSFDKKTIFIGVTAIAIVMAGRLISVFLPTLLLSFRRSVERHLIPILTWGGLRGGISVALALSLPRGSIRNEMVAITYIVVVFSIVVQGLTIGKLAKKLSSKQKSSPVQLNKTSFD